MGCQWRPAGLPFTASHEAGVRCQEPASPGCQGPSIGNWGGQQPGPLGGGLRARNGASSVTDDAGCLGPAWFHEMTLLRAEV